MGFTMVDESEADDWHPKVIVLGKGNVIIDRRGR
jgi:aspartate 1-decarboxylase